MNWEARDEFVEKMFRRSGSVYSRRYYGFGVDNFREFCKGAGIGDVDGKNVYSVMDAYVGYLHGSSGLKLSPTRVSLVSLSYIITRLRVP